MKAAIAIPNNEIFPLKDANDPADKKIYERASSLLETNLFTHRAALDRIFAVVLVFNWLLAVVFAVVISPSTWIGEQELVNLHIWIAVLQGAVTSGIPVFLVYANPGRPITRYAIVTSLCLFAGLFVHLTGGRVETHFYYFCVLGFFALYRDWKVLLLGTVYIAADHLLRGIFWPLSVYGLSFGAPFAWGDQWRWLEHASWVVVMDAVLFLAVLLAMREMKEIADSRSKLEDYRDHLEDKVNTRTTELNTSRKEMVDILTNISQGILTISREGLINPEYSSKVPEIFSRDDLADIGFTDLFQKDATVQEKIKKNLHELFTNSFAAEKFLALANPLKAYQYKAEWNNKTYPEKMLAFTFSRVYTPGATEKTVENIAKIMVVIDDKTEQYELEVELDNKKQEQAAKIEKLYQILRLEPSVFSDFTREAIQDLNAVKSKLMKMGSADAAQNKLIVEESFRAVHSLKGNARAINLDTVAASAHKLEEEFSVLRDNVGKISDELRNRTLTFIEYLLEEIKDGNSMFTKILDMRDALTVKTADPMQEFEKALRNIVKKESEATGKTIDFVYRNLLTPKMVQSISGTVLNSMRDSIIQLLRNAIDHGIESESMRQERSKPANGQIELIITEENDHLIVKCQDDGGGLDLEKIKQRAVENKISPLEKTAGMNAEDTYKLIFKSGLSTAERITETSGRGVGMDIVKEEIKKILGQILIASDFGQFTRFTLKIPLSAAA